MRLVLCLVCLLGASSSWAADDGSPLRAAISAYEQLEFERCVELLSNPTGKTVSEQARAALYRGLCRFNLAQNTAAKEDFKHALSLDRRAQLPADVSPKASELFQSAAAELALLSPEPSAPVARSEWVETPSATAPARASRLGPILVGATGLLAVGFATYFATQASAHQAQANTARFVSDADRSAGLARSSATAANVSWAGAGTALVAAATWWLILELSEAR
jgi:hypothetical protein